MEKRLAHANEDTKVGTEKSDEHGIRIWELKPSKELKHKLDADLASVCAAIEDRIWRASLFPSNPTLLTSHARF